MTMTEMAHSESGLFSPLVFGDGRCLPCRVFPGPMDGVTDGAFVTVLSRRGYVWSWHTPFLRISTGVPARVRLREKLSVFLGTGLPVNVQVMGTRVECLAATAGRLHELGATCVDLNCACPSATVLSSGSGGLHLRDLGWLREACHAMREACGRHGFSVKVRMGVETPLEFEGIGDALRCGSPDFVTVHYRTVREMYRPVGDGLQRLSRAVSVLSGIPVIGSGDLYTVSDCLRMCAVTGVCGVAPARGLMRNPRLLRELRAHFDGEALPSLDRLSFLLEICRDSVAARVRSNGFVLRLVNSLYGKDSDIFRKMTQWRSMSASVSGLEGLVAAIGSDTAE